MTRIDIRGVFNMGGIFERNKDRIVFFFILLLGVFLIFFRLTRADFLSDDAHYAYRSLDLIDFVSSQNQTTPLQWFGKIPSWSRLSFHDAPPLVFYIQHAFFWLFGQSTFVARLPFALAGLVSLIVVFLISRELYTFRVALLSILFLAVNPYFIWGSRIGFLESIELSFILASLYFFIRSKHHPHSLYLFGLFLGLAFLSKYTSFYLIPFFMAFIILQRRDVFKEHKKKFIVSLLITLVLFLPVIFYNIMMLKTRGHFDMQFSILFNQSMTDWPIINRSVASDVPGNFASIPTTLVGATSFVVLLVFLGAFLFLLYELFNHKAHHLVIILNILFLTLFFSLISPTTRYLPLFTPFLAMTLGYFVYRQGEIFISYIKGGDKIKRLFGACGVFLTVVFIGYQIFLTVNTNHLYRPIGRLHFAYLPIRVENLGFYQLDQYLEKLLKGTRPSQPALPDGLRVLSDKVDHALAVAYDEKLRLFRPLIIYDENLSWFARMWVFEKRLKLQYFPIFSFENTIRQGEQFLSTYLAGGVDSAYIILPVGEKDVFYQGKQKYENRAQVMRAYLVRQSTKPVEIIRGFQQEERFHVYYLDHIWETFGEVFSVPALKKSKASS